MAEEVKPTTDLKATASNLADALIRTSRMPHAAAVVASAAILDHDLERAIKTKFRPLNKKMNGRLFS